VHHNAMSQVFPQEKIEFDGQTYILEPPNGDTRRFYCEYLEECAIVGSGIMYRMAGRLPPALLKDVATATAENVGMHLFDWGGKRWSDSLNVTANWKRLAILTLGQKGTDGKNKNADFVSVEFGESVIDRMWDKELPTPKKVQVSTGSNGDTETRELKTYGDQIWNALQEFLNRPNSPAPEAAKAN
jgi:hypothetical protein